MSTPQTRSADSAAHQHLYDVFLSHQSGDKPLVESLAARLVDEQGLRPFLDKWHLIPGAPWQEALEEALDRSKTCVVFLGPGGLGPWENEEMRAALDERVRNKSFRVIPVLLPGAEPKDEKTLPRFLRRLTWVDFRGGLDDPDPFQRLVAGIRGVAPGRQLGGVAAPTNQPSRGFWQSLSARFAGKGERRSELWKIIVPAALALLLSTPFISAAIPRYKLQVKSPAFRKEGIYEAPAGMVLIKWAMTKEQWFRESDVGEIKANVVVKKFGDEKDRQFPGAPGELKMNLESGKYEVRIDATEYGRSETIALQVTPPIATYLRGFVTDKSGKGVGGAEVEVRDILEQPILKTTTTDDGGFNLSNIPAKFGDRMREALAAAQNNLGAALVRQGERSGGEESVLLLGRAVAAYREALKARTREQLPQDWAMTQDNLGKAYFLLKNWNDAAVCFENVLTVYPSDKQGYQSLTSIYHEWLFEYAKAFELHQKWLSHFPQDTTVLPDFAETHFTTGRFPEFSQRIKPLLTDPELSASAKIALQMIEVANLLALDNANQVPAALVAVFKNVSDQKADFRINWSFSGTLNFINRQERFVSYRSWLNQFFSAAREEHRDAILKALREAQAQFPGLSGNHRR